MTDPIANAESGLSVRTKLNETISKANDAITADSTETLTNKTLGDELKVTGGLATVSTIDRFTGDSGTRGELRIRAGTDSFSTGSNGSGLILYQNDDPQHPGRAVIQTGIDGDGDASFIVTQLRQSYFGQSIYDYSDDNEGQGWLNTKSGLTGSSAARAALHHRGKTTSTGGAATTPQRGVVLDLKEINATDIGEGEGYSLLWRVELDGDILPKEVAQIASYKVNGTDLDRTTDIIVSLSPDGNNALDDTFRFKHTGQVHFVPLSSDPTGAKGDMWADSTSGNLRHHDGTGAREIVSTPGVFKSGWVTGLEAGDKITITHNLGTKDLALDQFQVKTTTDGRIWDAPRQHGDSRGMQIWYPTDDTVEIAAANTDAFYYDNTTLGSSASTFDGVTAGEELEIRVVLRAL